MRLSLDLEKQAPDVPRVLNFCIFVAAQPDQFVILSGSQNLAQVHEKYWKVLDHHTVFCINLI